MISEFGLSWRLFGAEGGGPCSSTCLTFSLLRPGAFGQTVLGAPTSLPLSAAKAGKSGEGFPYEGLDFRAHLKEL